MRPEQLKLANCWEGFAAAAIPESAPKVQRQAMYQAFLAGAVTVLQYHLALEEHTPTNLKSGMLAWHQAVNAELARLATPTDG